MNTSIGLLVLAGYLVAPTVQPHWQTNYNLALTKGGEVQKPLAIVISSGKDGYDKLVRDGKLNGEARKVMSAGYICVYLDASKEGNKRLIKAFDIRSGVGLVLSDRRGEFQAFHHDGPLTEGELLRQLQRHAPAQTVVTRSSPVSTQAETAAPPQPAPVYSRGRGRFRTVQPSISVGGSSSANC